MSRAREALTWALLVALPWSTAAQELALGALLVLALLDGTARRALQAPWAPAAVAAAAAWTAGSFASGNLHEGLGHAWLLAPFLALAPAAAPEAARRRESVGLAAAALAAAWGGVQALRGADAAGTFSHHLTFAYALLPPFGVALAARRWGLAAVLAGGVLAARSDAAPLALGATALAVLTLRPLLALAAGAVGALAGLRWLATPADLVQRAVLWSGGLSLPPGSAGAGGYAKASAPAYDRLQPGFWFPNHAHDSFIQLSATLGAAGWAATALLVVATLGAGAPGAAAGLVGVLVGGLTQDTLGDLEVARAAWIWLTILGTALPAGGRSEPWPSSSPSSASSP